jgi:hypothetical protein
VLETHLRTRDCSDEQTNQASSMPITARMRPPLARRIVAYIGNI